MTYPQPFKDLVANTFLHTDLSTVQVANMYGVSSWSVSLWARAKDGDLYDIAKGRNRQLLMALDILEVRPNIRAEELATEVGVTRKCIDDWNRYGKLELDIQCDICGEATTTKYCKSCTDKGWHQYVTKMEITYAELCDMPTSCEVCGATKRLHVDHDHDTGKYRGVLCHHCNVALGMAKDDVNRLKKLIKYLERNKNSSEKYGTNILKIMREKYAQKLHDPQGYAV